VLLRYSLKRYEEKAMIYFIDDERSTISGYLDRFETMGKQYRCKFFTYGEDALKQLKNDYNNVNLIILDLMMFFGRSEVQEEKYGGITFLKALKQNFDYENIPILMYTGVPNFDEHVSMILSEYKDVVYLNRNCPDEEFFSKVEEIMNE